MGVLEMKLILLIFVTFFYAFPTQHTEELSEREERIAATMYMKRVASNAFAILRTNYENMTDISLITMRQSQIEQEGDKIQFDLFFYDEDNNQICLAIVQTHPTQKEGKTLKTTKIEDEIACNPVKPKTLEYLLSRIAKFNKVQHSLELREGILKVTHKVLDVMEKRDAKKSESV